MIGPHFTLVSARRRERHCAAPWRRSTAAFWFLIDRIARHDLYLYAEPSDGAAELSELHEPESRAPGEPSSPHHLGFQRADRAEQVARIVGASIADPRRVEELALLKREATGSTPATVRLGA
jgi:hypothetical protein